MFLQDEGGEEKHLQLSRASGMRSSAKRLAPGIGVK